MQPITIRFPDDVRVALREASAADGRSFNGEVVWMLRQELVRRGFLVTATDGDFPQDAT